MALLAALGGLAAIGKAAEQIAATAERFAAIYEQSVDRAISTELGQLRQQNEMLRKENENLHKRLEKIMAGAAPGGGGSGAGQL